MLYKEGMIVSGQTLRNSLLVFIKAKSGQRQKCQKPRDLTVSNTETQTVSTVTEMRRDLTVSNAETQLSLPCLKVLFIALPHAQCGGINGERHIGQTQKKLNAKKYKYTRTLP